MKDLIDKANYKLQIIFNHFIEEKVGNSNIKMMPSQDKIPIIEKFTYDKDKDIFEIVFKYEPNKEINTIRKGLVSFIEIDKKLVAVHIHNFSKIDAKSIRFDALTTIQNEIQKLSVLIRNKEEISNNIVEKRKLEFTNELLSKDYNSLQNNELEV